MPESVSENHAKIGERETASSRLTSREVERKYLKQGISVLDTVSTERRHSLHDLHVEPSKWDHKHEEDGEADANDSYDEDTDRSSADETEDDPPKDFINDIHIPGEQVHNPESSSVYGKGIRQHSNTPSSWSDLKE